jgi:solute carrier family 45 protein 1/2/4
MVGAILSCLSWLGMAFTKELGEAFGDPAPGETGTRTWTAFFTILFYLWMDITCNFVQTPSQLIIADLAGRRQTLGQAIGAAASTAGMLLVAAFIAIVGPAQNNLKLFLGFLAVIMIGTNALCCVMCKETPLKPEEVEGKTSLGTALGLIWKGFRTLPKNLMIYAVMLLCICYGNTAYTGAKGQFFGEVVFAGNPEGADQCGSDCTEAQKNFNHGTQLAGGIVDICYNIFGVLWALCLGPLVKKFGTRPVMIVSTIPLMLLIPMTFVSNEAIVIVLVILTSVTNLTGLNMCVPYIVNDIKDVRDQRLGLYTGALNSANCVGQFLNFFVSMFIVNTSWGYRLPVFVGGIFGFFAFLIATFVLKPNFRF